MFKLTYLLAALALGGTIFAEPANAVTVDYALTFTGSNGNGTGLLVINEPSLPSPTSSFSENFYGDLVSLQATFGSLQYNFVPSAVDVNLGSQQIFYGIKGSSSPGVLGPNGLIGTLALGGFDFHINNLGGSNLNDGTFKIGPGVAATPLPPTWTMMLVGLVGFGFFAFRRRPMPQSMAV